jgi:hypothetical protein
LVPPYSLLPTVHVRLMPFFLQKISVALDFTNLTGAANVPASAAFLAEAKSILAGVDRISLNDASVTSAEAMIAPWISSHPNGMGVALVGNNTTAAHLELG